MDGERKAEAVRLLGEARLAGAVVELPDRCRPADEAEAYAVQEALHRWLAARDGGGTGGWKIGATTPIMQEMLGVPAPVRGRVRDRDILHGSADLPLSRFHAAGVECEIALRFGSDLGPGTAPFDRQAVAGAVDACMVAAEIVDDRYGGWQQAPVPVLVADDFFQAACVLGPPQGNWRDLDLAAVVARTLIDGVEAGRGVGADALGHPLQAAAWLANNLAAEGIGIRAGEVVLTGSVVRIQWVRQPAVFGLEIAGMGEIEVRFA